MNQGRKTLLAKLLIQAGMCEADGKYISKIRQLHKYWQTADARTIAEHVLETQASYDYFGIGKV